MSYANKVKPIPRKSLPYKSGRAPDPKKKKVLPRVSKPVKTIKNKSYKEANEKFLKEIKKPYKIPRVPSNGIGVGGN